MSFTDLIQKITPILQRHDVQRAGIFGSVARKQASIASDIDLLVAMGREKSLFDFIRLKYQLEDALGMHVDLVEYDTIKPQLKDQILKDLIPLPL